MLQRDKDNGNPLYLDLGPQNTKSFLNGSTLNRVRFLMKCPNQPSYGSLMAISHFAFLPNLLKPCKGWRTSIEVKIWWNPGQVLKPLVGEWILCVLPVVLVPRPNSPSLDITRSACGHKEQEQSGGFSNSSRNPFLCLISPFQQCARPQWNVEWLWIKVGKKN